MHQRLEQATQLAEAEAVPWRADLIQDDALQLASHMTGCDAVVFSAGAHGTGRDQTALIDGAGLQKAADAAALLGLGAGLLLTACTPTTPKASPASPPRRRPQPHPPPSARPPAACVRPQPWPRAWPPRGRWRSATARR